MNVSIFHDAEKFIGNYLCRATWAVGAAIHEPYHSGFA